jgi:hypothetical protein
MSGMGVGARVVGSLRDDRGLAALVLEGGLIGLAFAMRLRRQRGPPTRVRRMELLWSDWGFLEVGGCRAFLE